ncbi:MAG: methyltransferase family protein, partial [Terracidiphilus sp.]
MSASATHATSANQSAEPAAKPDHILQIGLGFWASKTLLSAVEMEVFTELAKRPEDLETLSGRMGLHPRSARDFLDTLVALEFLRREDGVYSNTPATDLYLDKHKPSYIGGIMEMCNHRSYGHWNHLTEALRTGLPQNELKGGGAPVFETIYADPARLKEFLKAMSGVSRGANTAIAAKFPWAEYKTVVDAGPAQG